ncbi:unnamed protein product [Effrenium voratum]|nr:unnamed protein product [Effrenium voratum]
MSSRPEAMDIFTAYAEKRVKEEVARNTGAASSKETFAGAGLTWALELRALLQRSKEASDLVFLRMAWRGEALAVQLGPLCLEFGWELYGGEELICPVTEKCYVDLAQQLCDVSLPQLQGMGCSVTRAFAASCGIACHQCYVLSEPESLRGFRRLALGAGLLGHWVILQGMDDLEPSCSEACMNYLAKYMQQLSLSLEAFRDKREPEISASALEPKARKGISVCQAESDGPSIVLDPPDVRQLFAKLPPGSLAGTREESIWLTLDGPLNPELYEAVSAAMPLTIAGTKKPYLSKTRGFRIIVETDLLAELSPATAASLAVTFIDTERGPTWKDRAMAWAHRFVLTCPEYAHFMQLTKELLMHLMDSILAFVLYYFHYNPESSGAATEGEALDYRHQTTCFLSCLTSLLVDPVVEKQLYSATKEGQAALEREVRLLIGMSSGWEGGWGGRPRFERYIRENVLDPIHANSFPPLYDLYLDSKTGQFQAVGKIVHLTEPIVECHHVCVATEEFVAFQLRLRRLLAIGAPVLLAGTGGSGKSALLRYLHGCKSSSMAGLLHSCPELSPWEIQKALTLNLAPRAKGGVRTPGVDGGQGAGILAPGNEKRLVVFIDDLHLSDVGAGPGPGQTRLGEWIRFALEAQGFYRMEDGHFVAIRDTSFLPSLLAPDSQNLEICKRFSRHFFLAFMESPSEASIQKIFSTILTLNLTAGIPEEVMQNLTRSFWSMRLHPNVEVDTPGQKLAAQLLQATLGVWNETDLASKQRLHGLARVFWDVAHAFSRTPVEDLASPVDVGYLWTFAMRLGRHDAEIRQPPA